MVRLTQMKWKGTVSHWGTNAMATRLAAAKTAQATSSQPEVSSWCRRSWDDDPIPLTSHGGDRGGAELGPNPAPLDIDPVGPRGEGHGAGAAVRLAPDRFEPQAAGNQTGSGPAGGGAQPGPHPSKQLFHGERLGPVVLCARPQAGALCRAGGA